MNKKKVGRPRLGPDPLTNAERVKRWRIKHEGDLFIRIPEERAIKLDFIYLQSGVNAKQFVINAIDEYFAKITAE